MIRPIPATPAIRAGDLEAALAGAIRGEVRFDSGSRAMYARDASSYRQVPIGVVVPRDFDDLHETVRIARDHSAPILCRGGGTSLAGQCCNHAVVIDFTKYLGDVVSVDATTRRAIIQAGTILDDLRAAAAPHGLTFGPDPATHNHCTLGGMIGNNSCGVHSVQSEFYGPGPRTEHQVHRLTVLTYDGHTMDVGATGDEELERIIAGGGRRGQIYSDLRDLRDRYADLIRERFPDIPRRVSGFNLPSLLPENGFHVARALVGTESTCAITLEAEVELIENPPERVLLILGYPDAYVAGDHVPEIMKHRPLGLEGVDRKLVEYMGRKDLYVKDLEMLPDGNGWLMVEFGGDTADEAEARARAALDELRRDDTFIRDSRLYTDVVDRHRVWRVREAGLGATAFVPGMALTWEGWEDAAVDPRHIGKYLRDFRKLLDEYGYDTALYGHFGHGCVHCRIDFDYGTRQGLDTYRAFIDDAADLVLRYGGSLSGEHGDGQSRGNLLEKMYGPELVQAFREFKRIWDPDGMMNPGKVVDAYAPDENIDIGPDFAPMEVETHFAYPADRFDFANATIRCVGVGECRRKDSGTMCPSYMVTLEEKHSTRGRARLLNEMMRGEVITDGWRSEEVKEALDLCLACKGCKGDCPVDVDVATYKAEFLAHYYQGRLRPRSAYAMGLIHWWARIGSRVPNLVNGVMRMPGLSTLLKKLGGIHPDRDVPDFADRTFRDWYDGRPEPASAGHGAADHTGTGLAPGRGRRVIFWPDTFNDHFHPEVARAGLEVLEALGFEPVLPETGLCCGRPLYDFGMLGLARRQLARILESLRDDIRAGTPVVGLEPSCVATFRDELPNLFPHDRDAQRLAKQSYVLTEFLDRFAGDSELGDLAGETALVHAHCHHKAVLDFDSERAVLDRLGIDYTVLDSGCCGMAGSFGFEEENHEVSQACAERVLLPAVRDAGPRTLVVTSGFSCREQLEQNRLRRPLHTAELIHMALERAGRLAAPGPPARTGARRTGRLAAPVRVLAGAGLAWLGLRAGRARTARD